ncbi:MAG: thiosulfate oxidation carrier complex protein SoxZ [Alphaproteobacteria bacterium]
MATPKPRVKVPKKADAGEIIEIKTLISHSMESGQRKDKQGNIIPRQIINKFTCLMNGSEAFRMDLDPAISANPYISFHLKIDETSDLEFVWNDDNGETYSKKSQITVA